jgi:hypothetical protein
MPLPDTLVRFRDAVRLNNQFISRVHAVGVDGALIADRPEREFVVESAFLRMFVAWESFLEKALASYMLGESSASGRAPTRYVFPQSDAHCGSILIGTQKYVDWANPEIVRKLTGLYLDQGEPIAPVIASIQTELFDLKTVRNAAAHLAGTTVHALDALASRRLRRQCTGTRVTDFVMELDPASAPPATILDGYVRLLDVAAEQIVTWR